MSVDELPTTCAAPDCDVEIVQPRTGRRRRFCSAACKQRAYRASIRNDRATSLWIDWLEMIHNAIATTAGRTYGGHKSGAGTSVAEACRTSAYIDGLVVEILGGVPQPRAPRQAELIDLPAPHRPEERQAA